MTGGGAMEPVLEVRNLNTYYTEGRLLFGQKGRRHQVLKDVSFTIGQGEIVGLVGESGSGKTTLARTILGFVNDYDNTSLRPASDGLSRPIWQSEPLFYHRKNT